MSVADWVSSLRGGGEVGSPAVQLGAKRSPHAVDTNMVSSWIARMMFWRGRETLTNSHCKAQCLVR